MLVAIGLNQKGAAVADREALALRPEAYEGVLAGLAALDGVDEVALVSTCYRVEIYAASQCPAVAVLSLRRALEQRAGRELPLFECVGEEAFRHLVRVASSLESAILGEPQILGQVKDAFQKSTELGQAGKELAGVLGKALNVAKRVRTETAVGRSGVSWGHAAAALAEKVIGAVEGKRVLVVGAGEMARLSAQHLRDQGASIVVVNRTLANGEALAAEVGGVARPLESLEHELRSADIVVSAAPVVPAAFQPAAMSAFMKERRRSLVMVDLAVPRAIPAECGKLEHVYLCDVDDLDRVMRAAMDERAAAVAHAERIIAEEVEKATRAEAERRAAPLIQEMRTRASQIAKEEVEKTLRRLGEDPELAARLDAMAGSIVAKLLHRPSTRLREAARDGGTGEALVAAAKHIFDLGGGIRPGTA
ncbi:MAG: glutamyl-tRNA reductase [Anaeromyxobacter sp.]